jgi:2-polyprenyl-6-methoxyphenol hydroxylase-like FAD-dependent oxidoreductase
MLDALIIGAGPTGLSLAAMLGAVGASVRIVDRQRDRVHESRALAVQPRTLEVLRAVGLSQPLVDRGLRAVSLQMHLGSRVLPMPLFDVGLEDTAYPFLLFISQAETEAILNQHLAAGGVRVERPVELVAFEQDPEVVTCTLRHAGGQTEQARARYLVGCDGSRSTVRTLAGIAFAGGAYPQRFALGDLEVDGGLERGTAHVFLGERGMLFFFPLGTPATWRMLGMLPSAGHAEVTLDDLQAMADAFSGGGLRLRDPVWITDFRIRHQQAAGYRAGRVFLAGDAAHVHSPAGAQGMNTGIQDAWNLGWKLWLVAGGVAGDALLDSYQAERWPVGRFVLRFTDRAFRVSTSDNPFVRSMLAQVAPRLAPAGLRLVRARARGFRILSQLDVGYRRSAIVEEGHPRPRRGPRAGDRLPDARVVRDGQPCWLQEALAAPRYHLLLCGPVDGWDGEQLTAVQARYGGLVAVHRLTRAPAPEALHDADGQALVRLGIRPAEAAHYLVRPDGHIGFRGGGSDLRALQRHLAHWLPGVGQ